MALLLKINFYIMINRITKISMTAILLVIITSCNKTSSLGGAGLNLVRFPYSSPTSVNSNPIVALTGTQPGSIQVNRDLSDPNILNQAEAVTLSLDSSIIGIYNKANGT